MFSNSAFSSPTAYPEASTSGRRSFACVLQLQDRDFGFPDNVVVFVAT